MHNLSIFPVSTRALVRQLSVLRLYTNMMRQRDDDTPDQISATQVHRLLQELIAMAGQQIAGAPVLELQIGEFLTRTAVERRGADHYLSVTATLPKCQPAHCQPLPAVLALVPERLEAVEVLWHADEGRYIVVRRIPVRDFCDDRSVMDAILDTADLAAKYYAALLADAASPLAS